jgi:hypothetical protein
VGKMSRRRALSCAFLMLFSTVLIVNSLIAVNAWTPVEITAPVGWVPKLDGIKDAAWSKANYTEQPTSGGFPRTGLYAMINSSYLYILVEIKVGGDHNNDEYVKLLLSNSTASTTESFYDAKLIQAHNLSIADKRTFTIQDQHLEEGEWVNDTQTNFSGFVNISGVGYSYYEFKLPFSSLNADKENDTHILVSSTYAIKIQYGINVTGSSPQYTETFSTVLNIQVGLKTGSEDDTITEFKIDIEALSNTMFIIAIGAFVVLFLTSFQARKKLD